MKLQSYLLTTLLAASTLFTSCKKTDDVLILGSGDLPAGKGKITFSTSSSFGGSNSFDGTNTLFSFATRQASTAYDQVTIQAIESSGTTAKTAQLTILCAKGLTTSSGTINANFSNTASDNVFPVLVISNSANTNEAYASESGTVTITKLTTSEIEGTFSGHFINEDQGTSIEVTNGAFAGKF